METLFGSLVSMAAAAMLAFSPSAHTQSVSHAHLARHARPIRCVSAHARKRTDHPCRKPAKRHAKDAVSKTVRHNAAKHTTTTTRSKTSQPAPTPVPVVITSPAPSSPSQPAPPTTTTTPVTPAPLPVSPASLSAPSIAGTPAVGSTLQASLGSWANGPTSYTYHWSECPGSCTGSNGVQITGASGRLSYVPQASDVGDVIYLVVTAQNAGGQATAYSAVTASVASSAGGAGTGAGTLVYDGTFGSPEANYPDVYGNCASVLSSNELEFDVTSSCNPGGDGHYRTDYATPNVYPAGAAECTSVPFDVVNLPTVPVNSWLQFAEAKDAAANTAGWAFAITSYYGGVNELEVQFNGYNNTSPAWTSTTGIPAGWNTLSICTNDANDSSGVVYGIWLNGVRQVFNHGPASGAQTLSGFAIIDDGASSWPLDINDYTGGSPANQIIHGEPLIATAGSSGLPPEPSAGWTSP
jgi:hypothetical protein